MRFLLLTLVVFAAAVAPGASADPARTLARGELALPAATAFGEPGFHEVLAAAGRVPSAVRLPTRFRLVLTLRDASRPRQGCSSDHPLSGCATVDWADDQSRPKVPAGGVFRNSLTVRLAAGVRTFFLQPSGQLATQPISYQPG